VSEIEPQDRSAVAKAIVDANRYMTLGTADETGLPWVSPVWYAPAAYRELYWVSSPEARHSRNIAVRPQMSIVIFDSNAPVGSGQGLYMSAVAKEVAASGLDRGMEIFSQRSQQQGARPWTTEDVQPPAPLRLYHAVVSEHFVLSPGDERLPVSID
jgi:nitroimidazol reductase NimA-like FMN-containing flavoprotein (pyridoxamine 5'-phosphate oxidase superfamily)